MESCALSGRLLRGLWFGDGAARGGRAAGEEVLEVLAGVAFLDLGDILGRAGRDDAPAAVAAFGAEVDDPVGGLDDVEVVLDDDDGVARVDQLVQHFEELCDVVEVEAGGGLVEDVERAAGGALGEFLGELDALGFAAGERRRLLADVDVAEADARPACRACRGSRARP